MSIFIKDWEDLNNIPKESKTHILEIDMRMGCAWLRTKDPKPLNHKLSMMRQIKHQDVYLSTHTFYGKSYKHYEKLLHACGFDVTLANWDAEDQLNAMVMLRIDLPSYIVVRYRAEMHSYGNERHSRVMYRCSQVY